MQRTLLLCIVLILGGCDQSETYPEPDAPVVSDIKSDEFVVFFRTSGWLDEARQEWHLPIHGWIYEPQDSTARKAILAEVLESQYELVPDREQETNFSRRVNLLIADNERDKQIVVDVAGRKYALPASAENGQFETTLLISAADAEKFADDSLIRYAAVTSEFESRTFAGEVRLVGPAGVSVISDIDDTVKITNVNDRKSLLEHTFLLDFAAAPGMAQLYSEWSARNVSFHFVSSSPLQLYSPLREFLDGQDFPWSTFSLKTVRFRDETLFDLFKEGTETKPAAIEKILRTYPGRTFVLVGDSGEQDPEVYANFLQKHPDQILSVLIRNVTKESEDNARFQTVFENVPRDRWQLFDDPQSLVSIIAPAN